ncbi:hypothetical protein OSB04_012627 [Centaurea solstitialis]|uniref:HECT-type E3 ubiquitin transferase n=1 Tax=Centaurea solstitialis TaxID=347529 RepID=A0AA38TBR5_9ASTR|nr:hypothetical protein OSB04_012627 [Centaurea solstitialis]
MVCVRRFCKGEPEVSADFVKSKLMEFVSMIPRNESIDVGLAGSLLEIFTSSCVSQVLVMLYTCQDIRSKECARESIQELVNYISFMFPQSVSSHCAPILLGFCKLLRKSFPHNDPLYKLCTSRFGKMVKDANNFHGSNNRVIREFQEMFPSIADTATMISEGLVSNMESLRNSGPQATTISFFKGYLDQLKFGVREQVSFPIPMPSYSELMDHPNKFKFLYILFDDLLTIVLMCLDTMEEWIEKKEEGAFPHYLVILKELHDISKLYQGGEDYFWSNLRDNTVSLCYLILRYAKRGEDYEWLLEHKDMLNFESRRHLMRLLLPRMDGLHPYVILIDRSRLLVDSFDDIAHAEPDSLHVELSVRFKNEEAVGHGVLREWFFLVCQEIFNPKNGLFVPCPNDQIRFFPKQASKWDMMHLEYYKFAGRVIALALMNIIQVGIAFERSFFMQLAGNSICLEDIRDADPFLYSSCHHILDLDPLKVDQDVLGLTFVWSINESGSVKDVELCPGGKNIIVNSRNRKKYVDLLIHHSFVVSVAEQITHFARGFSDIVGEERI